MTKESIRIAIILAGGFGTRLRSVLSDIPKPMAPVGGKVFLEYQMNYLSKQGIQKIILGTGYQADIIKGHFGQSYNGMTIIYSHEENPLGTGGAIKQALKLIPKNQPVVILNGDSYFQVDIQKMFANHLSSNSIMTLALLHRTDFERYGTVEFDETFIIHKFKEKQPTKSGWISAGIYISDSTLIGQLPKQDCFSIESDFFEIAAEKKQLNAFLSDSYFIDIGIPEDYEKAQKILPIIDKNKYQGWTLFLDRDGVINSRKPGDYVKSTDEWSYIPRALDALFFLSQLFDRIVVVTNQQGVGLKKMSSYMLDLIHQKLIDDVRKAGGQIDKIYASIDLKDKENNSRKPNPTMAGWAKRDFPDIDFSKSIMFGDSATDIEFGKNLGMKTVHVLGKEEDYGEIEKYNPEWQVSNMMQWIEEEHFASTLI